MQLMINVSLLCLSIFFLWKGAEWIVEHAARIGRTFGLSDLAIGLTIVAFGTSAPEFAVTISAAISGQSNISVGNIVGSNIFNLGFILGSCAAIKALKVSPVLVYRDGALLITTAALLVFMLQDLHFSRMEGVLLISGLLLYLIILFTRGEKPEEDIPSGKAALKDYFLLIAGIGSVIAGGHLLVTSASELARMLGISEWVIAVTIVAAGTSAPEFATSIMASTKGRHGLALGNLIGSDLYNLLGVLGLAGTIRAMDVAKESLNSIYMLLGMCIITVFFLRTDWKISRKEGVILVLLGLLRWGMDFLGH